MTAATRGNRWGSSGIANNAFYLLANGGKNRTSGLGVKDGVGMEKGLKIFARALEHDMTPNVGVNRDFTRERP